jgi:CHAT domain-containing protein/tetratricopeptide (TPR) repeat protein
MRLVFHSLFLPLVLLQTIQPVSSQDIYKEALSAAGSGRFADATEILMGMLRAGESDANACLRIAEFAVYSGNLNRFRKQLEQLLETRIEDPAPALTLAFMAKLDEDWSDSYRKAQIALERGAIQPELISLLVEAAVNSKKTDNLPAQLQKLKQSASPEMYDFGYAVWRALIRNHKLALKAIASYLMSQPYSIAGLQLQARLLTNSREFIQAIDVLHKAKTRLSESSPAYPDVLVAIGENHFESASSDSGVYYLLRANEAAARGGSLLTEARIIDQLIPALYARGRLRHLTGLCEQRLKICLLLKKNEDLPQIWLKMATFYYEMRNYSRTGEYVELLLKSKHATMEQKAEAAMLSGRFYRKQNNLAKAEEYFEKATDFGKDSKESRMEHLALYELADIYGRTKRQEAAKRLFERVRTYGQRSQQHDLTEAAFVGFAQVNLREPTNYADAEYYMRMADGLARQTAHLNFSANHRWLQGKMWLAQNEIEDAETFFMRAVELGKETGGYLAVIAGQSGLVKTYLRAGFKDLALEQAEMVLVSLRQYYAYCRDEREIRYFDLKSDLFFPVVEAFASNGKLTRIFDASELYDAFMQNEQLESLRYQLGTELADSVSTELLQLERGVKSRWQEIWSFWRRSNRDNLEMVTAIKESIDSLHTRRTSILASLDVDHPELSFIFHPTTTPVIELRDNLQKTGCYYLKYLCGQDATYAILVSNATILCKRLEIGGEAIERLVRLVSPTFHEPGVSDQTFDLGAASFLYEVIFAPIIGWLPRDSPLIINPDTPFGTLPFEMLVKNREELTDSQDYIHAKYLLGDYAISYVYRGHSVLRLRKMNRKNQGTLLAFCPSLNRLRTNGHPRTSQNDTTYIHRVSELAPGNSNTVLLSEKASLESFKLETPGYRLLHAVLPVNFDRANPLYSSMIFPDDARLLFYDFFGMSLNSEFVLLETRNMRPAQTQTQNTLSCMIDALHSAGINSFATNLWGDESAESHQIIIGFYRNLKEGISSVRALQKAKIEFISRNKNPHYWAGLVSIGQPAPIDFNGGGNYWLIFITIAGVAILGYYIFSQYRSIRQSRSNALSPHTSS